MVKSHMLKKKKEKRVIAGLSSTVTTLMVALVATIAMFTKADPTKGQPSDYGSTLLSGEAGAFVLVAVLAFILGVVTTALVFRYRRKEN